MRGYKYRFYPNKEQVEILNTTLDLCRNLYNAALQQRIYAHRAGKKVHYLTQQNELPKLKKEMTEYQSVYSQVLVEAIRRLDGTYREFFKRVKRKRKGENIKAGFPRFKPEQRYNSFTYTQLGFKLLPNEHIHLSKIGELRVFRHRAPLGKVKTVTVKRDKVGDWFITVNTEMPDIAQKVVKTAIGIDLGLNDLVTLSSGETISTPKFLRETEGKINRAYRVFSRRVKGSRNREKARIRLAKLHRKVNRQRDDFLHKTSLWLVKKADLLVFEDLKVATMMRNHKVAKSIGDASWSQLVQYVSYKAEYAGKRVELVDPRGTTQTCSRCGTTVRKSLCERMHECPNCGLLLSRDFNAAINILNRSVAGGTRERTPVEIVPTPVRVSTVIEAGSSHSSYEC